MNAPLPPFPISSVSRSLLFEKCCSHEFNTSAGAVARGKGSPWPSLWCYWPARISFFTSLHTRLALCSCCAWHGGRLPCIAVLRTGGVNSALLAGRAQQSGGARQSVNQELSEKLDGPHRPPPTHTPHHCCCGDAGLQLHCAGFGRDEQVPAEEVLGGFTTSRQACPFPAGRERWRQAGNQPYRAMQQNSAALTLWRPVRLMLDVCRQCVSENHACTFMLGKDSRESTDSELAARKMLCASTNEHTVHEQEQGMGREGTK